MNKICKWIELKNDTNTKFIIMSCTIYDPADYLTYNTISEIQNGKEYYCPICGGKIVYKLDEEQQHD